ncbi:hypothetical protein [Paludisphaera soli]|uniref:hypothetical protein n=1 Tax=Paludisphaera soli TaxID=2712865 RepID=UPI0013EBA912|nr:hypothetical protein [Paludisphaera soli]
MRSPSRHVASLILGATAFYGTVAIAQEAPRPAPAAPRADYKVVAWFDRARPIASFQYQVYDVRKGDYTPAVQAWVAMMAEKFPNYDVAVRDVDLGREEGPNETRKVGAVVHRELLAAAAAEGIFLGVDASARSVVSREPLTVRLAPIRGTIGPSSYPSFAPMMYPQGGVPMGFPVPMPFPRPHP